MKLAVVVSLSAVLVFGGAVPAEAGKQQVSLTFGAAESERGGGTVLTACGLSTRYGRIVVHGPADSQYVSADMRVENGCVTYPFNPPEPGTYTAQAYSLSGPGKTPHIGATLEFEV